MAVKISGPSRATVTRLSSRPELAPGFYTFVPVQVSRIETEDKPLRIMVRLCPLRDSEDVGSIDKSFSEFMHLYPDTPNPLNADISPMAFMVEQTVDYLLAAFPDDLDQKVRFVNKQPVLNGEAVDKKDIEKLNAVAVKGALDKMAELWNDDDVETTMLNHSVIGKVHHYTKKDGTPGKRVYFYGVLPNDATFVDPSDWEFYVDKGE